MRWVRRGSALAMLIIGWVFILVMNHFHITPSTVFVCLAYFCGVAAIYTLYRLGATAVTATNEEDDAMSWAKPLGALDELEREKRALLKAIKEAEFDLQMGKLSKADADSMIGIYRARAIEVIKEIDVQNSTSGKAGSVRDRILREARARIQVEEKAAAIPAAKKKDKKKSGDKQQDRADKLAEAVKTANEPKPEASATAEPKVEPTAAATPDEPKVEPAAAATPDEPSHVAEPKSDDQPASNVTDSKSDDEPASKVAESKPDDQSASKEAAR